MDTHRYIIGCMTGTSLDGLDAVLARVHGERLTMSAAVIATHTVDMPDALRTQLRAFAHGDAAKPIAFLQAARALGELHAVAVGELLAKHPVKLHLVAAHGQTIWHAPHQHLSWQLFDPWPIVRTHNVPVVYDLRQADLIAGGEGAPITPLSDWVLFRHESRDRLIVNLGGICNVTYLPGGCTPDDVCGEDIGPCNLLLDGAMAHVDPAARYDAGGRRAANGQFNDKLYQQVMRAEFFQRPSPRSTGREDFSQQWLDDAMASSGLTGDDLLAGAVEAVALQVAAYVKAMHAKDDMDIVLSGGGVANDTLVARIRHHVPRGAEVLVSDDLGVPVAAREALGFAVLGALSQDGVPITLPAVTGASSPGRAGAWVYP